MSECRCLHFEGTFSRVCWCKDCDQIRLRCGCVLLPFKTTQVKSFLLFLQELQERKVITEGQQEVQFKFAEISLFFSAVELSDLIDVLGRVQLDIQRDQLEALFSRSPAKSL